MNKVVHEVVRWRKSSFTADNTACVELAHTRDLVRDSKHRAGPVLTVPAADLVAAVKAGRLVH